LVDQANVDGKLLGWTVIIAYWIAGPLFIISGIKYGNELKKQKARIIKKVDSVIDNTASRGSLNESKAKTDTQKGELRQ